MLRMLRRFAYCLSRLIYIKLKSKVEPNCEGVKIVKITLEENQTPLENKDCNNGLLFNVIGDGVFVQIGSLSIRVEKDELEKVLKIMS
jgi:hypothetical protein